MLISKLADSAPCMTQAAVGHAHQCCQVCCESVKHFSNPTFSNPTLRPWRSAAPGGTSSDVLGVYETSTSGTLEQSKCIQDRTS